MLARRANTAVPGDVSSQFISGLLFALPVLRGDSALTVLPPFESCGYVDSDARRAAPVRHVGAVRRECDRFFIPGNQHYQAADATCEGDWSQAAFFFAMNALGGEVQVDGLNPDSLQGDRACAEMLASHSIGRDGGGFVELPRSRAGAVRRGGGLRPWRALYRHAAAADQGERPRSGNGGGAGKMRRGVWTFWKMSVHVSPGAIHAPTEHR